MRCMPNTLKKRKQQQSKCIDNINRERHEEEINSQYLPRYLGQHLHYDQKVEPAPVVGGLQLYFSTHPARVPFLQGLVVPPLVHPSTSVSFLPSKLRWGVVDLSVTRGEVRKKMNEDAKGMEMVVMGCEEGRYKGSLGLQVECCVEISKTLPWEL